MTPSETILVTGGAGFIGSAFCRIILRDSRVRVCVFDKLTYSANLKSLEPVANLPNFTFVQGDICDAAAVNRVLSVANPHAIVHFAAESHVDRSIDGSADFVRTNIVGTHVLLEEARAYWIKKGASPSFRFLHVSTDEVFGSLGREGHFTEETRYDPRSPYSASKAASDHLVRAWAHTYGLPVLISNCSNNFGPYQFPEKLIPLMILNALEGKELPVYGDGGNVRDWLYVDDHIEALKLILNSGRPGETYLVGGGGEKRNLDVVHGICDLLDELKPAHDAASRRSLVRFVTDRPGHDQRYAIDSSRIRAELGWRPKRQFEDALRATVRWYLDNRGWWEAIRTGAYRGERLGLLNDVPDHITSPVPGA